MAQVAAFALVLQALLSSFAPVGQISLNPLDRLPFVICSSSGDAVPEQVPAAPRDHGHAACCILCVVPGLDTTNVDNSIAAPDYRSSFSSPLTPWIDAGSRVATELSPINPRAPPAVV
jgi:hypothetical protein